MPAPAPAHLSVILVEPQNPGNIGMACRAMANFGLSDLRLVNPCPHLHPEARKFAVSASGLLGSARLFPDLATAIADLPLTVAATRRSGRLRGALADVAEVPALLAALPEGSGAGLVFGREDSGLTTGEVALCTHAAAIATAEYGSLNLAQAVIIFLYETTRAARTPQTTQTAGERLPHGELEPLFTQIESVLSRIAFLNPKAPQGVMTTLRRLHHRADLDRRELDLLRGMWSQLAWSIRDWQGRKRAEPAPPEDPKDPKDG